jgi:hypothetical protein
MSLAPWTRPLFQPGGPPARLQLWAFAPRPLNLPPINASRHGVPKGADTALFKVSQVPRAKEPAWFAERFEGGMGQIGREELGEALFGEAQRTRYVYGVSAELADPKDLSYLQTYWAFARWLCEAGAVAVCDVNAARWWGARQVLGHPKEQAMDLSAEIAIVVDTQLREGRHLVHTRGMVKFGRPDLVLLAASGDELAQAPTILISSAQALALGARLGPGGKLDAAGTIVDVVGTEDVPGGIDPEMLNNTALQLKRAAV